VRIVTDIFEQYRILVHFLGDLLSPNYEIALLDLRNEVNCITNIVNGHVTGRKAGAPITDLALQIMQSGEYKTKDYLVNYTGMSSGNRVLRSSSLFIKDGEKLLGMFCINIDMSSYIDLCEKIMQLSGTSVSSIELISKSAHALDPIPAENFSNDLSASIDRIIRNQCRHLAIAPDRLNKQERVSFLESLNKTGIFLMKGSIPTVAARLKCSEATVYRYLSKINQTKNQD
jgi:predicted transcriptional regulator YheO